MDSGTSKVFIVGVKSFSVYYLADSDEVVSRLQMELESSGERHPSKCDSWDHDTRDS